MNRYTVLSLIGEGSFGRVYRATRKVDAQTVAIKVISKRGRSNKELKNLRRECDIQSQLKHPNVIEMLESFETKNDLVVVTECALIDLHRYMFSNGALPEQHAQRLICHLVSALYYLHSKRILHRDLKPQNVLLNEDLHAKLCDFGLARNMTMGTHVLTSIKGTPLYMAPELLAERPYDHQADLWSLGCIAYECLAGQPPFFTTSILHLVKLIKHEDVNWPSVLSSDCRSFLQGLLEKEPTMRTSWAQILCHPFVEGKLYISGIKAEDSPFTNPSKTKRTKSTKNKINLSDDEIAKKFSALHISNFHNTNDNLTTSRDSINAIPPSDIEVIETDVEENLNRVAVPFAHCSFKHSMQLKSDERPNLLQLMAIAPILPTINPQACYISGNSNMVLNNFDDNFAMPIPSIPSIQTTPLEANEENAIALPSKLKTQTQASVKKSRNKDVEKRKLNQNLIPSRKINDALTQSKKDKCIDSKQAEQSLAMKSSTQSTEEKHSTENTPPCLLPGWDSCDETQSPPIENDEWLAFLHRTMQEVLDGELESLKQHNLVSIIVAPLRNSKAIPKVVHRIAQLLSLPFVLSQPDVILELIQTVYIDVKLVPNLMYASKLLLCQKCTNDSTTSLPITSRAVRPISELCFEEIRTTSRLYELTCYLVHLKQKCLSQFCDAVAILAANELFINFLTHDSTNPHAIRISNCVLALFCCVLRELPENAELVERIAFSPKVNLITLLGHKNDLLRRRMCMLFRLLARFSLRGLQCVWTNDLRRAIEKLAFDEKKEVKTEAESTLGELRKLSFYALSN